MSDNPESKATESSSEANSPDLAQPAAVELVQINQRVDKLEGVFESLERIMGRAGDSFEEYLKHKTASEERALQLEDKQHKRAILLIGFAIGIVFAFCCLLALKDQWALISTVLTSSLAVGAGASLGQMLRKSPKRDAE